MKQCPIDDCDEEIMDWQSSCYIHRDKINEEKKKMEQQEPRQNNYGNPTIDHNMVKQSYNDQSYGTPSKPPTYQQSTPNTPIQRPPMLRKFEKPDLTDRDRLIVKQVCLKESINVLNGMDAFNSLEYNDVLDKLRRMTVDFYNIIIEKNEVE